MLWLSQTDQEVARGTQPWISLVQAASRTLPSSLCFGLRTHMTKTLEVLEHWCHLLEIKTSEDNPDTWEREIMSEACPPGPWIFTVVLLRNRWKWARGPKLQMSLAAASLHPSRGLPFSLGVASINCRKQATYYNIFPNWMSYFPMGCHPLESYVIPWNPVDIFIS